MGTITQRLQQFRHRSPLSFRLLIYILLCSSVFTLFATGVQLYSDYRRGVSQVSNQLEMIETGYRSSLASSVWALDRDLVDVQLEGILSLPDLKHLRLTIYPDSSVEMGSIPEDTGVVEHSFELAFSDNDQQALGHLEMTASKAGVYEDLRRKIMVILTTQTLKTFFLSFLIIWIIQILITRHLGTMASYARSLSLSNLPEPLTLSRSASVGSSKDELGQVTEAINEMRQRLQDDYQQQLKDASQIRKLSLALEQSPSSVLICNRSWRIEYANKKFRQLTGYELDDIIGKHPVELSQNGRSDRENDQLWHNIRIQVQRVGIWQGEMQSSRRNGERFWEQVIITPIHDEEGKPDQYLIIGEDISIRKRYEQQLLRQANYDILTGLPNRMLALDRLKLAIAQARRDKDQVGVMFMDLDNFKHINDTLGHDAGDKLLIEASRRISSCLRGTSTVARLGGDEFLVILPGIQDPAATEQVAERVLQTFYPPFLVEGQEIFVTTSIGIAIYPQDSESSSALLQQADAAMYEAKHQGKSSYQRFLPEMKELSQKRLQMEGRLRRALELGEFQLHYQPIVTTEGVRVVGAEALLRWDNPTMGMVPPDRFIPLAEETGLIIPIGRWVLNEACQAARRWDDAGIPLIISVNVSPRQFRDPGFVDSVAAALEENQLEGNRLELEITERLILDDTIETADVLAKLDQMGVRLSVDDFGTGYSALSYLKSYPFDTLKIDKSFVRDILTEKEDAALIKAIITMAHSLKLTVIAEGVEEPEQISVLKAENCDFAQGFYYSRPIPEAEFVGWIKENQHTPKS